MYRFIQNIGDYFNPGYFTDDFKDSVFKESGFDNDSVKELNNLPVNREKIDSTLREMIAEEELEMDAGMISLSC